MANILVVDDEAKMRHLLSIMLEGHGHTVENASDGLEALELIKEKPFDMVITDIKMPRMSGIELLDRLKQDDLLCPVVFITAFATVESAVDAMRMGAVDYITKPFEADRIRLTVERTLNLSRVIEENRELKKKLRQSGRTAEIIYRSAVMERIMQLAGRAAKSESVVMVTGESGTGKELLARFIHDNSTRMKGRFVAINCAAIAPTLVEAELYGYEKGAFTGAARQTQGKFEYAARGTLFMDEIGDLPPDAQAKLLRALQEKTIMRVGGNREIPVDVRIVCATNQNLKAMVEKGAFRQDLFFRINVLPIELPPLRQRIEDVSLLCEFFLKKLEPDREIKISDGAMRLLTSYPWPGNIRELANAMERAVILSPDHGAITVDSLSFLNTVSCGQNDAEGFRLPPAGFSLEHFQQDLVRQALDMAGNNQTQAAKLLGLTRAKFRVLMKNATEGEV